MTDAQQHYRVKQSMYQIARQLDMPASFIELRHRVTHEVKPNMLELERAAKQGLSWLFAWYWIYVPDGESISAEEGGSTIDNISFDCIDSPLRQSLQIMFDANIRACNDSRKDLVHRSSVDQAVEEIVEICSMKWERLKMLSFALCVHHFSVPWSVSCGRGAASASVCSLSTCK